MIKKFDLHKLQQKIKAEYICRWLHNARPPARLTCGGGRNEVAGSGWHDLVNEFYDIIYILKGEGYYIDHTGQKSYWQEGCIYQRIPGYVHTTVNETESIQLYFSMPPYCWQNLIDTGIIDGSQRIIRPGIHDNLLDLFFRIREKLCEPSDTALQFALNYMQQFIVEAVRLEMQQINTGDTYAAIETAATLLADPNSSKLTIHDIAAKAGLGYEAFRKHFRRQYDLSPHAYRIKRRIEAAASWLCLSDKTIEDIAQRLGYPDPFTFSKQFKKQTGYSPLEYRKVNLHN